MKQSGFTKTETITMALIILGLGLMANYHFNLANAKARDYERKQQIKQIAGVLEDYKKDNGAFPPSTSQKEFTGCGDTYCPTENGKGIPCNWEQNSTPNSLTCGEYIYLDPIPRAPMNPAMPGKIARHHYVRISPREMVLETCLELKKDIEAKPVAISLTGYNQTNCTSGVIFQIHSQDISEANSETDDPQPSH